MKKRLFAWLLLVCMLLSACAPNVTTGTTTAPEATPGATTDGSTLSQQPIPAAQEPSVQIHYQRTKNDYDEWGFWIWQQGAEGEVYAMNYMDDFGGVAVYPLSSFGKDALQKGIGIIPRRLDSWTKDGEVDRLISFSDYEMDENNYYHLYIKQGDTKIYMNRDFSVAPAITEAAFVSMTEVSVEVNNPIVKVSLYEGDTLICEQALEGVQSTTVTLPEGQSITLGNTYRVEAIFQEKNECKSAGVSCQRLYSTDEFNELFYYDGELGAIYTSERTEFKVWSPVSSSIVLNIYEKGYGTDDEPLQTVQMVRGDKGVFAVTLEGDYAGKYYTYTVTNSQNPDGTQIVDPYAKSAGLNGVRGMIVDFSKTNPEGWDTVSPVAYDRKELVVWETHVADVTSSKTWTGNENWRKKFLGMIQQGTTYTEDGVTVTTGFDHIKELGVNAVQLIPVFDQANDESNVSFNWGYNPLNYNVLEGAYSTDPENGYARITEFKQLVQAYNAIGVNIVMDVVYNHVSSANGSNFDVLMPGYYFRYNGDGTLANGSGCGNETASENAMMRKFIIDSVCFWAEEYKLGGFRFDLMGLHDIDTMNELAEQVQKINPNIVIYGEPWTGGTSALSSSLQSTQVNANKLDGVGQFNDQMRDALIKGGLNSASAKGWITNANYVVEAEVEKIIAGLQGITKSDSVQITDPDRTVNYVTCHDNYTLYDRIRAAGITDEQTIEKMALLANAIVLTSNGTSFMLAGEEFLRSKGGDENSYESSYEVNELDYALKIRHQELFANYRKLIAFKKETACLHLQQDQMQAYQVSSTMNAAVIEITFTENGRTYKIIHANGTVKDCTVDLAGYTLLIDTLGNTELSAETAIGKFQTIIAYR